jgi:hypothetical protein
MDGSHIEIIALAIGVIGSFLSIFGVWYRVNADTNSKIDSISKTFADQLAKAIESGDEKRARIYERIDSVKNAHKEEIKEVQKEIASNYVPMKICSLMHSTSEKTMGELKASIKSVEDKVDKLIAKIYENNGK